MAVVDYFASSIDYLENMYWWQKLILGTIASFFISFLIRTIVWGPLIKFVEKSEIKWDDDLIKLATPLANYAVFLSGLYLTILWSLDSQLTPVLRSTIATLLVILLLFLVGSFLTRSVNKFLPTALEKLDKKSDLGLLGGTTIISGLLKVIIWSTAALVIMAQLNINITGALASLTIFSLVIGMAMQESASNMIISTQLMIDKPFQVGDKIEVMSIMGVVVEIGFMSTKIRTPSEQMVILPNKIIASEKIINYAKGGPSEHPRRLNLRVDFTVSYDESPAHVKQVLQDIANSCDYISEKPEPKVLFTEMQDSSLVFRLNCWVTDYLDEYVARDFLLSTVLEKFREESIDIPYPHMQIMYEPPVTMSVAEAKKIAKEAKSVQREKEVRQKEAEKIESEIAVKVYEERQKLRERSTSIRDIMETKELSEEERSNLADELIEIEEQLNLADDD